jgi:YVTN family beta-propeller protein
VAVGTNPSAVAITPNGAFAYVTNDGDGTVSVINTATNTVVATVAVQIGPLGLAITSDGAFVYVTNQASSTVSVIDTTTNAVVATVTEPTGSLPYGVAITPSAPPTPTTPNLTSAVSGMGNITAGQTGASYSITVSNAAGAAATSGTVTVTDPPTNFTVTAISGSGWSCTLATLTCTRSDVLPAGQSYPPITVTGNVTGAAGQTISIPITISGGGLTSAVTSSTSIPIVSPQSCGEADGNEDVGDNHRKTGNGQDHKKGNHGNDDEFHSCMRSRESDRR